MRNAALYGLLLTAVAASGCARKYAAVPSLTQQVRDPTPTRDLMAEQRGAGERAEQLRCSFTDLEYKVMTGTAVAIALYFGQAVGPVNTFDESASRTKLARKKPDNTALRSGAGCVATPAPVGPPAADPSLPPPVTLPPVYFPKPKGESSAPAPQATAPGL